MVASQWQCYLFQNLASILRQMPKPKDKYLFVQQFYTDFPDHTALISKAGTRMKRKQQDRRLPELLKGDPLTLLQTVGEQISPATPGSPRLRCSKPWTESIGVPVPMPHFFNNPRTGNFTRQGVFRLRTDSCVNDLRSELSGLMNIDLPLHEEELDECPGNKDVNVVKDFYNRGNKPEEAMSSRRVTGDE